MGIDFLGGLVGVQAEAMRAYYDFMLYAKFIILV